MKKSSCIEKMCSFNNQGRNTLLVKNKSVELWLEKQISMVILGERLK